jgi:predicted secreted protein
MRLVPSWTAYATVVLALLAWAPAPSAATADTITVGQAASGGCRTLDRGDVLVVRLSSNPSTGYAWRIRSGGRPVLALAGRSYLPPTSGQSLGAPGTAVFRFRATVVGKTMLRLVYVRSWETGVAPEKVFTLRVTVS